MHIFYHSPTPRTSLLPLFAPFLFTPSINNTCNCRRHGSHFHVCNSFSPTSTPPFSCHPKSLQINSNIDLAILTRNRSDLFCEIKSGYDKYWQWMIATDGRSKIGTIEEVTLEFWYLIRTKLEMAICFRFSPWRMIKMSLALGIPVLFCFIQRETQQFQQRERHLYTINIVSNGEANSKAGWLCGRDKKKYVSDAWTSFYDSFNLIGKINTADFFLSCLFSVVKLLAVKLLRKYFCRWC